MDFIVIPNPVARFGERFEGSAAVFRGAGYFALVVLLFPHVASKYYASSNIEGTRSEIALESHLPTSMTWHGGSMMTPELQALSERLEELEKQVAHLAALVVKQSDTDRTVSARTFVVTDGRGIRRAELGVVPARDEKGDLPWIGLFDTNGGLAACMGLGEDGSFIELYRAERKAINLSAGKDGSGILLLDPNGKPRFDLSVLPQAGCSLTMIDGNGTMRVDLSVSPSGEPRLNLLDANGDKRLTLDIAPLDSGSPGLILRDPNGRATATVTSVGDRPGVCLLDPTNPDGNTNLQFVIENGVPSLVCVKDGKVLWSAP